MDGIKLPIDASVSYQRDLANFVVEHKLHRLVETGLGVSSVFLLDALDRMNAGHLTSVDPSPWYKGKIEHPRHTHVAALSSECLWQIDGPWDLFLHDGDHDIHAQTLEFNFAWGMLRHGGWLVADDWSWGGHDAWRKGLAFQGIKDVEMGPLRLVQKDGEPVSHGNIASYFATCLGWADDAEREWLAAGNKNSDAFENTRRMRR
jgi:hypothetical protein